MAAKRKETNPVIRVANTDVTIGDTYQIVPKPDFDAPSGFIKEGTTKLLMKGIKEVRSVAFDSNLEMWDTGFDELHPCNGSIPKEEKAARVKMYVEHFKKPYENKFNKELDSTKDSFWQEFGYEVYTDRLLDTNNEKQRLELFCMLKQGAVCNEREKDSTLQRSANYCIKNVQATQTMRDQREDEKLEAMGTLVTLLNGVGGKEEDDTLYTILEWMNIPNIRGAEKESLKRTVLRKFEDEKIGYDNVKRFLEAFKMTKNENTKEEMELFSILTKLYHKGEITFKHKQYYLYGERIGNHLKETAKVANERDQELKDKILEAYRKIVK